MAKTSKTEDGQLVMAAGWHGSFQLFFFFFICCFIIVLLLLLPTSIYFQLFLLVIQNLFIAYISIISLTHHFLDEILVLSFLCHMYLKKDNITTFQSQIIPLFFPISLVN